MSEIIPEDYYLTLHEEPSAFAIPCSAADCSMMPEDMVKTARNYFVDRMTKNTYCEQCGCRLRYHRKKWSARGEALPRTLEAVSKRHSES